MATDLLARVRTELEERMAELRPLLSEYERLLAAADTLASIDASGEPLQPAAPAPPVPAPAATENRQERATPPPRASTQTREQQTPAPTAAETRKPAASDPEGDGYEYEEYEPQRKPASPDAVQQAILAALEHGSHTVSELVMVTAMKGSEIRGNLSRLARRGKVTRVKREGDGKSAYALPLASARA